MVFCVTKIIFIYSSTKSRSFPYVSGKIITDTMANVQTIRPVIIKDPVMFISNCDCRNILSGIKMVTAPLIKLVTVAVTVTLKLVPKCSAVVVTKTER